MPHSQAEYDFEIQRSELLEPGHVLAMGEQGFMEIVENPEHADGVIYLGGVKPLKRGDSPGLIALYFTYYIRLPGLDVVDHEATILAIQNITDERLGEMSRQVHREIREQSFAASLCFNPVVSFFQDD